MQNTDRVRPAALTFLSKGRFTDALPGTRDYYEYWDEEARRCMYGYTIDDLHVQDFIIFI